MIGYALMAPAPPFPVFVLGYVFNGFGIALQVSTNEVLESVKLPTFIRMLVRMGMSLA